MSAASRKAKKDLALYLYTHSSLSGGEIAAKAGVAPQTLSRWINKEDWKLIRSANQVTRKQQVRSILLQLDELNQAIANREEGARYANAKESDTILKLTRAIESIEKGAGLDDYVSVFEDFFAFMRLAQAEALMQQMEPLVNQFLLGKAGELA